MRESIKELLKKIFYNTNYHHGKKLNKLVREFNLGDVANYSVLELYDFKYQFSELKITDPEFSRGKKLYVDLIESLIREKEGDHL